MVHDTTNIHFSHSTGTAIGNTDVTRPFRSTDEDLACKTTLQLEEYIRMVENFTVGDKNI